MSIPTEGKADTTLSVFLFRVSGWCAKECLQNRSALPVWSCTNAKIPKEIHFPFIFFFQEEETLLGCHSLRSTPALRTNEHPHPSPAVLRCYPLLREALRQQAVPAVCVAIECRLQGKHRQTARKGRGVGATSFGPAGPCKHAQQPVRHVCVCINLTRFSTEAAWQRVQAAGARRPWQIKIKNTILSLF